MTLGANRIETKDLINRFEHVQWDTLTHAQLVKLCQMLIGELDCAFVNLRTTSRAYHELDGQYRALQVGLYEI